MPQLAMSRLSQSSCNMSIATSAPQETHRLVLYTIEGCRDKMQSSWVRLWQFTSFFTFLSFFFFWRQLLSRKGLNQNGAAFHVKALL